MAGFISRVLQRFYGTREVSRIDFPGMIGPGGRTITPDVDQWIKGRQGRGTDIAREYGHADALLAPTEIQRLLSGEWVDVVSTWIAALQYRPMSDTTGALYAWLKRGKEYGPTIISPAELAAGASSASKGHWLNNVWKQARKG